jgi:hypothetical protein
MSSKALNNRCEQLPTDIHRVVDIFVEALLKKEVQKVGKGKAKSGSGKVKIWMADDFNTPSGEFKECKA